MSRARVSDSIMHHRYSLLAACLSFMVPCAAQAVEAPNKDDIVKNDAQYSCMNFVIGALDEPKEAKADFFEYFPVKILPDGSYNVIVTYTLSGQHKVSCTIKKAQSGSWTLVETKEVRVRPH